MRKSGSASKYTRVVPDIYENTVTLLSIVRVKSRRHLERLELGTCSRKKWDESQ